MNRILTKLAGLLIVMILAACNDQSITNPPLQTLERAPSLVEIAGRELTLETYLGRDFQPNLPPGGKPLIAVLRIATTSGAPLPEGLRANQVAIVYGGDIWTAATKPELPSSQPNILRVIARDGPKWGPGVVVDVIVRFEDAQGHEHWLRAADQPIHRTD